MKKTTMKIQAVIFAFILNSCAAQYETIGGREGAKLEDNTNNNDIIVAQYKPTANIEVILNGKSVTSVPVGSSFTVQPTADSWDPALKDQADECRNPGITSTKYTLEDKNDRNVERPDNCSSLAIEETYNTPGEYIISLTVKDSNGESASASMTLSVFNDRNGNGEQDEEDLINGEEPVANFRISANPMTVVIGSSIEFNAVCEHVTGKIISWNFADNALGQGTSVTHTYSAVGTYHVTALCRGSDNKELQASLTVVVTKDPNSNNNDGNDNNNNNDDQNNNDQDDDNNNNDDQDDDNNNDDNNDDDVIIDDDGKGSNPTDPKQNNTPSQK